MKEKFSDYESKDYLAKEGTFTFTITDYELTEGAQAPIAKFNVECEEGSTTIRHSLSSKARWSYNNLIKACLHLNTKDKINAFECDYETIGNDLVGKQFVGVVQVETYEKPVKKPLDDGTFEESVEIKEAYRIVEYKEVN